jgi:hypothetical protein
VDGLTLLEVRYAVRIQHSGGLEQLQRLRNAAQINIERSGETAAVAYAPCCLRINALT